MIMNKLNTLGLIIIMAYTFLQPAAGAKILGLFPLASRSHMNTYKPVLKELALRGHEITVVSTGKPELQIPNIKEIDIPSMMEIFRSDNMSHIFEEVEKNAIVKLWNLLDIFVRICEITVDAPIVHELVKKGRMYDIVLVAAYANECAVQIAPLLAKHVVLISASPLTIMVTFPYTLYPSFIPERSFPLPPQMNFIQRLQNSVSTFIGRQIFFWIQSLGEQIVLKSIPNAPSMADAQNKISLILLNTDPVLSVPQPYSPRMIPVGAMHLSDAKPLAKEFKKFVESSGNEGFIIFTLGSITPSEMMPTEIRDAFISAFSRLKQKVIWKYSGEIKNLPPNVMLSSWLPQQDLLGHPKIRLFITHCGLLGLQEAIYFGVPVIGIPLYGDQAGNLVLMKAYGLGEEFGPMLSLTADKIYQTLDKVLNTKSYSENMKKYSVILRDQPGPSVKRAAYWVEYVLRHNGAHHLRSFGEDLGFIEYFLLDVIGLLLLILGISLWMLKLVVTLLLKFCRPKKSASPKKKHN